MCDERSEEQNTNSEGVASGSTIENKMPSTLKQNVNMVFLVLRFESEQSNTQNNKRNPGIFEEEVVQILS